MTVQSATNYEPPIGGAEEVLCELWQELLQVTPISRNDNFFELGGHSLLAIKMLFKVKQRLHTDLNITDVYQHPSIRELAARVANGRNDAGVVDLASEAALVNFPIAPLARVDGESDVLLTGSTGFVGRFLLRQLLRDTTASIYCLVRAKDAEPHRRLLDVMARWGLYDERWRDRVIAIQGDLRLPGLGLSPSDYTRICQAVGSIYHCGTSMHHLETYEMARPANVTSVRELLAIAVALRLKTFNYISTLGVFSSATLKLEAPIGEDTPIDIERHSRANGYLASKWVAEQVTMNARKFGIPCNIFRLGLVWADSEQGRYDELQHGYRLLKTCLLTGLGIENYRYPLAPVPVDQGTRAIVALARSAAHVGRNFHIAAPGVPVNDIFERCNAVTGAALQLLPLSLWLQQIKKLQVAGVSLPIAPLLEFYENESAAPPESTRISTAATELALRSLGITPPEPLGNSLLRLAVDCMRNRDGELEARKYRWASSAANWND